MQSRMLTSAPGCRAVCKDKPGEVMEELVGALTQKRGIGLTEAQALQLVRDPATLVHLFSDESLGKLSTVAQAFVESGCAECAVNKAFTGPKAPILRAPARARSTDDTGP